MSGSELEAWMRQSVRLDPTVFAKTLVSCAAVLLLWLLRYLAVHIVRRRSDDAQAIYRWRKRSAYLAGVLGALVLGWVWFEQIQSLSTFLGLASAGLAIALQEPLTNLAGWCFIVWRRPFAIGDRIQIGEHAGDVVDVRLFQFRLLEIGNWVAADQSTGRLAHVPNRRVFVDALINYGQGFEYIWNEIPVRITFESDWRVGKALLQEIADRHAAQISEQASARVRRAARRYAIVYSALTPTVYTRGDTYGVLLTVRYLCEPRRRRSTETAIWEDILQAFSEQADVEFAYPTRRFFDRRKEA